jgi:hypothetical protein
VVATILILLLLQQARCQGIGINAPAVVVGVTASLRRITILGTGLRLAGAWRFRNSRDGCVAPESCLPVVLLLQCIALKP